MDGIQKFNAFTYKTVEGETITATKQNGMVTLVGDKNGVRRMPMNEFMQEFINSVPKFNNGQPVQDTVNFSDNLDKSVTKSKNRNKGIALAFGGLAVAIGAWLLTRGHNTKSLNKATQELGQEISENVVKKGQDIVEETSQILQNSEPKMQMTSEAKKIYDNVDKALHEPITTSAQTIEKNLAPEISAEKATSVTDSKPMREVLSLETPFQEKLQFAQKYVKDNMQKLDELLYPDETVQIDRWYKEVNGDDVLCQKRKPLSDLLEPDDQFVDYIYHGTSVDSKEKILKEGFSSLIKPRHGYLDGVGGPYFAFVPSTGYGDAVIKAQFNGKVAKIDTALFNMIRRFNTWSIEDMLKKDGFSLEQCLVTGISDLISMEYLRQKIIQKGFDGIRTAYYSGPAGGHYFSALNPKLIKIIE